MSAHHPGAGEGPASGCSPVKVVRRLGSERRETVRSLSTVGAGELRVHSLDTRGTEADEPGVRLFRRSSAGQLCSERISAESI